jgi:hypothetical protein
VERFTLLLRDALDEKPERVPVKVPRAVKERRLDEKRRRGSLKRDRSVPVDEGE